MYLREARSAEKGMNITMRKIVCMLVLLVSQIQFGLASQKPSFRVEAWEERLNRRQPPIRIMDTMGLRPGMVIGEIGAGTGRMTMWLAQRVENSGKVYANDIDRRALDGLQSRCQRDGFTNVEIILGEVRDPKFPEGSLDIAFMINVYHHLDDPLPLLRNILPSLKADGILVIVECTPEKVEWGEEHGCTQSEDMRQQLDAARYELIRVETFLDEDNLYIAKPRAK